MTAAMQLPIRLAPTLAWLVDEASAATGFDRFLAALGTRLAQDGVPLAGAALTVRVPDPIIARRTWLWRAETSEVIEALAFALMPTGPRDDALEQAGRDWLLEIGNAPVLEHGVGTAPHPAALGWIGERPLTSAEADQLAEAARFATAPLAALSARAMMSATLNAYIGKRSAARVMSGPLRRDFGETIQAALLFADLRGFTELSETAPAATVIAALNAWFDRIAGATHAFGGEVLKFVGDGMLAIFPMAGPPNEACRAALQAVKAARAGMAHLNAMRQQEGLQPLAFGAALHVGEIFWGNIGAADRLDFTAIGPAVNLVSRLEGLCKPLNQSVLISGAIAAHADGSPVPLGRHALRGIAAPCAVFTLPEES